MANDAGTGDCIRTILGGLAHSGGGNVENDVELDHTEDGRRIRWEC